jgi:hypothetical protein
MPKFQKSKAIHRGGSAVWFYLAIVALAFGIYSLGVALNTADRCGSAPKEWIIFPPEWRCNSRPGFG